MRSFYKKVRAVKHLSHCSLFFSDRNYLKLASFLKREKSLVSNILESCSLKVFWKTWFQQFLVSLRIFLILRRWTSRYYSHAWNCFTASWYILHKHEEFASYSLGEFLIYTSQAWRICFISIGRIGGNTLQNPGRVR